MKTLPATWDALLVGRFTLSDASQDVLIIEKPKNVPLSNTLEERL